MTINVYSKRTHIISELKQQSPWPPICQAPFDQFLRGRESLLQIISMWNAARINMVTINKVWLTLQMLLYLAMGNGNVQPKCHVQIILDR